MTVSPFSGLKCKPKNPKEVSAKINVPIKFSLSDISSDTVIWEFSPNNLEFANYGEHGQGFYEQVSTELIGVGEKFDQSVNDVEQDKTSNDLMKKVGE